MDDTEFIDSVIVSLERFEKLSEQTIKRLIDISREVLCSEPNILKLKAPISICGDVHGQFSDVLNLFKESGLPGTTSYLFLGDYVDRGTDGIETFLYLLAIKIKYGNVWLIRGNHESRHVTQVYGFYDECVQKYDVPVVWLYCCDLFPYIPLCAIIDEKIICLHGGLSPELPVYTQLQLVDRLQDTPTEGIMSDIMWSDPHNGSGWAVSPRGAGYLYGEKIVEEFLQQNKLTMLVRAHQLVMEGYKEDFNGKVITVWSAPNYCYRCKNVASVLKFNENLERSYVIFKEAIAEQNSRLY